MRNAVIFRTIDNRKSTEVDRFLKTFNIKWEEPFGYIRDYDGEMGFPCSGKLISDLERLMYKYEKKKVMSGGTGYWTQLSLLELMQESVSIFIKDE